MLNIYGKILIIINYKLNIYVRLNPLKNMGKWSISSELQRVHSRDLSFSDCVFKFQSSRMRLRVVADLIPRERGMHFRKLRGQPWKIISVVTQHMSGEYERLTYIHNREGALYSFMIHTPTRSASLYCA